MSRDRAVDALDRLVELRELEVERLSTDVERKRESRDRYRRNLQRLQELADGAGASSVPRQEGRAFSPALSLNCGGYKQAVMTMMDQHRVDLTLHEADMALAQENLLRAARRQEALDLALQQKLTKVREGERRHERKTEDGVAGQMWWRVHR